MGQRPPGARAYSPEHHPTAPSGHATRAVVRGATQEETGMLELGIFHNGASDLPKKVSPDGLVINDGTLADSHASFQRVLLSQVRQGILADRLGYNYWFMTEHHFQPEGPEFSPNPLLE